MKANECNEILPLQSNVKCHVTLIMQCRALNIRCASQFCSERLNGVSLWFTILCRWDQFLCICFKNNWHFMAIQCFKKLIFYKWFKSKTSSRCSADKTEGTWAVGLWKPYGWQVFAGMTLHWKRKHALKEHWNLCRGKKENINREKVPCFFSLNVNITLKLAFIYIAYLIR